MEIVTLTISAVLLSLFSTGYGQEDTCGRTAKLDPDSNIETFLEKNAGVWPWLVSVQMNEGSDNWSHQCGGSLVTLSRVITAAHCPVLISGTWGNTMRVVAGDNHLQNTTDDDGRQEALVVDWKDHPEYRYGKYRYDIAILILETPLTLTSYVQTVCLPPAPFPSGLDDEKAMFYAGWGESGCEFIVWLCHHP
eukprot:GFUD01071639.1.p1 GENE.GFUD01071639.1~~GFUD01071639.1.p1  ORF type:complete len:193 (+),score=34.28 GFUD01071639.1:152-730(+)